MISYLTSADMSIIAFIGVIFAFALTCIAIAKLNKFLPKDLGRQFAVDGKLSAGKPRGAGILYIHICDIGSAFLTNQCGDCHLSCAYSY
jgi:phospho-N-acetylmuramoyl-pentapeptide-transferase